MINTFKELINSIYVAGYFNSGEIGGKRYTAKPLFVLNLLKGSVDRNEQISFDQSAINGYISGDNIGTVAASLKSAGFSRQKVTEYIESLYDVEHKASKTYNERFGDKTYKEALYEKLAESQVNVTVDSMAEFIARSLDSIIAAALPLDHTTDKAPDLMTTDKHIKILISYTIKNDEKEAMTNLCGLILDGLKELQKLSRIINNLTAIIRRDSTSEDKAENEKWKNGLGSSLAEQISEYNNKYIELKVHYSALAKLLSYKGRLHDIIKVIRKAAKDICSDKYLISQDNMDFSNTEGILSGFEDSLNSFLAWLNTV